MTYHEVELLKALERLVRIGGVEDRALTNVVELVEALYVRHTVELQKHNREQAEKLVTILRTVAEAVLGLVDRLIEQDHIDADYETLVVRMVNVCRDYIKREEEDQEPER